MKYLYWEYTWNPSVRKCLSDFPSASDAIDPNKPCGTVTRRDGSGDSGLYLDLAPASLVTLGESQNSFEYDFFKPKGLSELDILLRTIFFVLIQELIRL